MIVLLALDNNNGMTYNHRRQSKDKGLRTAILSLTLGKRLWMNPYSFGQFKDMDTTNICVSDGFLGKAENGDYCFVENESLKDYLEKIEELRVFRWNRVYPQDESLDISLEEWKQISTRNFPGSSHEKITEEVYLK